MDRPRRLLATVLATVLGIPLLAASAEAEAGAAERGTVVMGRSWAERVPFRIERLEDGTWSTVDWTAAFEVTDSSVEVYVDPGSYRVSWYRQDNPTFGRGFEDVSTTYYPGVDDSGDATVLTVQPGSTSDLTTFVPRRGGHLTGQVVRADGSPLPGVAYVEALRERRGTWEPVSRTDIDADGTYSLAGLDSGPTIVRVSGPSVTGWEVTGADAVTYSGDATTLEQATRIDVVAATTTSAGRISVVANGSLSGVVRDPDGVPLAGVEVDSSVLRRPTTTRADGTWTIGPLRAGPYEVSISDPLGRVEHERRTATVSLGQQTVVTSAPSHLAPRWSEAPTVDAGPHSVAWDQQLTVDPGVLLQDDAVVTGVAWYDGLGPERTLLGTGPTYTAPRTLDGAFVSAEVTATRKGLVSRISSEALMIRDPEYFAGRPSQSSTAPVAHEVLEARPGTVSPVPATTSWQWLRDGRAIPGATAQRYRTTAADVGHTVVARAQVERPGYARATLESSAKKVVSARSTSRLTLEARGSRKVTLSASVSVPKVAPTLVDGVLELYRSREGSDRIGTVRVVDGRATVTLARQPKGTRTYWVRFRPSRDGMLASTSARARTAVR
jgi:hypothetical protein